MRRQATQAERDAMQRLADAERAACEARAHLLAVIRREARREHAEEQLLEASAPDSHVPVRSSSA